MKKKCLAVLLAAVLAVGLLPATAFAADSPAESRNCVQRAYTKYGSTINSYLYENESGGLTRVEYIYDHIVVEDYDSSFRFQSSRTIPMELNKWGGFFAGETCNFFVFGQYNYGEDDSKEVIRVVKYSKDWQRLGEASLLGANTVNPFPYGSLRFAEYNGMLYIRTCHEMYKSSDGRNHQANLTMAVRESDMTVTDAAYRVAYNGTGYVSHSFNQFIMADQQQRIVALDHGDGFPRGVVLSVFPAGAGSEKITGGRAQTAIVQSFPGTIGDNTTGAALGGLAETANGYVAAYNYDGKGSTSTFANRSVYFAYVNKSDLKVTTKAISSAGTLVPILVPTGLDGGYILWNAWAANGGLGLTDTLCYASYSDGGIVGEVKTAAAALSDCQPILYNGAVVWYTTDNTAPTFYVLDESGVHIPSDSGAPDQPAAPAFTDVPAGIWYADAVAWAAKEGYVDGTGNGTFTPLRSCTEAEILTLLWHAKGSPQSAVAAPIPVASWAQDAVNWAYEQKLIDDTFQPGTPCTRAASVYFLWLAYGGSQSAAGGASFPDVPAGAYYAEAVSWAVGEGIVEGSGGLYNPNGIFNRASIALLLYRTLVPEVRVK